MEPGSNAKLISFVANFLGLNTKAKLVCEAMVEMMKKEVITATGEVDVRAVLTK